MNKLKTLFSILLAWVLLISTCGCTELTSLISTRQPSNVANPDTFKQQFENNLLYNQLDSSMQQCYGTMYTALSEGFYTDDTICLSEGEEQIGIAIELPETLSSKEDARELYGAFFNDNPQFFHISNTYGIEGYEKDGVPYYNKLVLPYTMNANTRKNARSALNTAVKTFLRDAPDTTDEYVLEEYLHDKLASACVYDSETADGDGFNANPNAYTAYGALVDKKAVCEGYSRGLQLLFNEVGIVNTLVVGESIESGEGHMWNLVRINGDYYHLDATWNDTKDLNRHNYFNITTEQLLLTHRIDDGQPHLVECTATKENYYHRNGLYINTYNRQIIAQKFAEAIKVGKTQLEMQFAVDKFDNARLFLKNWNAVNEQVSPYLAATGHSLWEYSLYSEKEESILLIRKK